MNCKKCNGLCCRNLTEYSIIIFPKDILPLADLLKIESSIFLKKFCLKHKLTTSNGHDFQFYSINPIEKRCPFLGQDGLCKVYPYRPTQCKNTPYDFFSNFQFWDYMPCVDENYDRNLGDSFDRDYQLVKSLLTDGYAEFEAGKSN